MATGNEFDNPNEVLMNSEEQGSKQAPIRVLIRAYGFRASLKTLASSTGGSLGLLDAFVRAVKSRVQRFKGFWGFGFRA